MKIVYIITRGDSVGGAQIHVRDLSTRLIKDGHSSHVITGTEGLFTEQLKERGVPYSIAPSLVRPISPSKDIKAVKEIRSLLEELNPDLVSTHGSKAGAVGRIAARRAGNPVLFTAHGWAFTDGVGAVKQWIYASLERFLAGFSDHVITVSENDYDLAVSRKVVPEEKMTAVHNGLPQVGKELLHDEQSRDTVRLIMIARFQEQKDHRTLFRALEEISSLPWECVLVGGGPLESEYKQLARELRIYDNLRFLGERGDVPQLMSDSDIFLLISHWEGFPRSTIEAMRCGLPVVVSDVGGSREAVVNGETGYLIPRQDPEACAYTISELIKDRSLRRRLGKRGRERYLELFTFDHMYEKTAAIYNKIMERST